MTAIGDEAEPTNPAVALRSRIDHILSGPPNRWQVLTVRVLDEPVGSDHRMVLAGQSSAHRSGR